jgi:membrane-bound metal-dependent hydrolase YbcI (DUF457 family)
LLPDVDHPNASIARSLPPVSNLFCKGVGKVVKHRHGTHSLLGVVSFTALASLASLWTVDAVGAPGGELSLGAGLLAMFLVSFALKTLRLVPGDRLAPWVAAVIVAGAVTLGAPHEWAWLPLAVGLGVVVHIVGDMLTTGGCPLLWPWEPKPPDGWATPLWKKNGHVGLPLLGNTGSRREWVALVLVSVYAAVGLLDATFRLLGTDVRSALAAAWRAAVP